VWEHVGNHDHMRPPGGPLSKNQQDAIDEQVSRRSEASVHQLRTGDIGPNSVPLSDISETLANPRAARYQVAQSQIRLGIAPNMLSKGGLLFLQSLSDLRTELKQPFLVNSSIHGPVFLTFQTSLMKDFLEEAITSWVTDISDGPEVGRHGFVTDGDHSFFQQGVLVVSCVFNSVLSAWSPVLYTWIQRQDIPHYRPHFQHISQQVINLIKQRQLNFNRKFLLHVCIYFTSLISTLTFISN
jgi:hypothetical protein